MEEFKRESDLPECDSWCPQFSYIVVKNKTVSYDCNGQLNLLKN